MNENTLKLTANPVDEFMPLAEKMLADGCSQEEVANSFRTYLHHKKSNVYKNHTGLKTVGSLAKGVLSKFNESIKKQDSRIELVMHDLLKSNDIPFKFQYPIGPYRIDFLVKDFLVVELDGPTHDIKKAQDKRRDAYLIRLGYKVLRVPVWVFQSCSDAVIEEIREAIQ